MKKILTTLLLLLSLAANAQTPAGINGIKYLLWDEDEERTASVISKDGGYSGDITIPQSVTYNGVAYSVTTIDVEAFYKSDGLTSVKLPNSITRIETMAFCNCPKLTSVNIPGSVTYIGDGAFSGCPKLASVTIPGSVTSIGMSMFYGCSSLTSVTIPGSVTSIGEYAFQHCSGLTSLTIPKSVTSIGQDAFWGCDGLTSLKVETGNKTYDSREDCNAIIETSTNTLIIGCKNTAIPGTVTSIGQKAFYNCDGLTSVTIPNSVTSIGESAFYDCQGLTSLTIPKSVTSIGHEAFFGAGITDLTIDSPTLVGQDYSDATSLGGMFGYLETLKLGNNITRIGDYAFYHCSGLTSVTIPGSVTSIGEAAFRACGLTSVAIPSSVTRIEPLAFANCNSLTSVTIPNSVTSIGQAAFTGCNALTSVTFPNSVTSIENQAFYACKSLTEVNLGSGIKTIGNGAFQYCKLRYVTCHATTVPTTASDAFGTIGHNNERLTVPSASVEAYRAQEPWSSFWSIEGGAGLLGKCANPTITFADGKLTAVCKTEGAVCHLTASVASLSKNATDSYTPNLKLKVTAYATAEKYLDSDPVTETYELNEVGDMNGDGKLTIEDIAKLIDKVQRGR